MSLAEVSTMKPTDGKPMEVSRSPTGNGGKLPNALVSGVSESHSLFRVYRTPTISIALARKRSENLRVYVEIPDVPSTLCHLKSSGRR